MELKTIEINKGIRMLHIPTDKFKTVNIALLIRNPLERENVTKNALIPPLLKRGSAKHPTLSAINTKADELYGAVFDAVIMKKGEEQLMQFYMEIINGPNENLLHEGLELLSDIVLDPLTHGDPLTGGAAFSEEFTEGEKDNLRRVIQGRINDKKEYAKLRCLEEMCKDEPFGIYGDGYLEDLDEINNHNLYARYKEIIAQSPMNFIIIGDCHTEKTADKIKQLFNIARGEIREIPKTEITYNPSEENYVKETSGIAQAKLCMGLRSDSPNSGTQFYELLLMNEIFGGSPESKLFVNVREKESLCYYVNSFVYRFKSIIFVQSGVDEGNFQKTVDLIKKQLDEIKRRNVSEEEIEKAKKSLTKKLTGIHDDPQGVMDFYLSREMLCGNESIDEAIEAISNTDKEGICKAAERVYVDTVYMLSSANKSTD